VALFDACVLYPFHFRNIVVQAAVDRLVEARVDRPALASGVGGCKCPEASGRYLGLQIIVITPLRRVPSI
jgi:hypothetical protein